MSDIAGEAANAADMKAAASGNPLIQRELELRNDRFFDLFGELVLDLGAEHHKPLQPVATHFVEPKDYFKPKFGSKKQAAAEKDIIVTTEKTLNATLKSYGVAAFGGFLNADARVVFPGYEPVIGKDKIIAFYNSMVSKMSLRTTDADKAAGGDLAYTYGVATIDYRTDLRESFNYVFIYERQPDYNWNLIQQIYTPAER